MDAVFLDFRKAFDKVPHNKLIQKLKSYGINDIFIKWISAFLKNRKQMVVIDGHSSKPLHVPSGVPQGSVLGPLLFLLYINDLGKNLESSCRLFADDTVIYREISKADDSLVLQRDLNRITDWCRTWKLELNINKCSVVNFWHNNPNKIEYVIDSTQLKHAKEQKYLGVILASDLSWKEHIRRIVGTARKRLGFVRRILGKCDERTREIAYFSLVRPLIEYASSVWDPHELGLKRELEKVQRKGARFVKRRYDREISVSGLMKELEWEPLEKRRERCRHNLFHKLRTNSFTVEMSDITKSPNYVSHRDHQDKIREIDCRTDRYKESFFPRTIREHNRKRNA